MAALPDAVPSLSGVHPVLARSGPGAPGILVEGRRACARSGAAAPTIAIEIDGIPLAEVATDGGRVANTLAAPGHARREIVGKSGVGTESLVAAPTLPLVCLQWEGARVPVRLLLDADAGRPSERSERGLVFALPDGRVAAVAVAPDGAHLVASEEPGSWIAEAPDAAEHLSVLVAAGSPTEVRTALSAAAHLVGHTVRAGKEPTSDGLTLRTGVEEVDDGLAWLRSRVSARCYRLAERIRRRGAEAPVLEAALLHALAALSCGDVDDALALHDALPPGGPERTLVAARVAATRGDSGPARAAAAALSSAPLDGRALWRPALSALADALRYAAPEAEIAGLRERARTVAVTAVSGGRPLPMASGAGSRALPMARGADETPSGLAAVLAGDPEPYTTDPDAGWASWRRRIASGLEAADHAVGWDAPCGDLEPPTSHAAWLALELAHGVLGLAPDAPVGRIRVAPRLPAHARGFEVIGVGVGDARLRMAYERVDATHRFRLEPGAGAVPPLVVFEPAVDGRVLRARVDGETAPLDGRATRRRTVVPVQLPIDGPREVEVDVEPEA